MTTTTGVSTDEAAPVQPPAPVQLLHMLTGTYTTQAISVTARLGVPDALYDGPLTVTELSTRVGAHADTLHRLLRVVTDLAIVSCGSDGRYALGPLGDLLRSNATPSLRAVAVMLGMPFHRHAWTDLYTSVRTGQPAFERVNGAPLFDYLGHHPDDARVFDEAMNSMSESMQPLFLAGYDFGRTERVVDVGGGRGALLAGILRANPHLTGVLCEAPAVLPDARHQFAAAGVADRVELAACDFFTQVPATGDLFLLSNVLHDWDDARATKILRNCRAAARSGSRLLVVEGIIPDDTTPSVAKIMDLEMLCLTGGRQRTVAELSALLAGAGYHVTVARAASDSPAKYVEAEAD
jgi:SAM-dependent methyltransferase